VDEGLLEVPDCFAAVEVRAVDHGPEREGEARRDGLSLPRMPSRGTTSQLLEKETEGRMSYNAIKRRASQLLGRTKTGRTKSNSEPLAYELNILRRYWPEEGERVNRRLDRGNKWIAEQVRVLGLTRAEHGAPTCDASVQRWLCGGVL
jgi:hypothetical protein